jgi:hypothetical protein
MLSNFQEGARPLLQSFLLGQPQFRDTLASEELEQLRQRVTANFHLGPIDAAETRAYIEHRLQLVSWRGDPEITDEAFARIFAHTGGVPRRINNLCTRLLLFGTLEQLHRLDGQAVEAVVDDLRQEAQGVIEPPLAPMLPALPAVTTEASASVVPIRSGEIESLSQRILGLERIVRQHDATIARFLNLTTQYFSAPPPAVKGGGREK